MMWYTHVVFGVFFYLVAVLLGAPAWPLPIGMAAFGALMPDIDHPNPSSQRNCPAER